MKRCTATLRTTRSWEARRWASHDKSALTHDALLRQVEGGLGIDADGNPIRVDTESGTLPTATGDLPISPVFDPAWIKSRRRQKKARPTVPTGRFRGKLGLNPFARALATPMRHCAFTDVDLPRYFLQDIELVRHPTTGEPWYAPGPLSFDHVIPKQLPHVSSAETIDGDAAAVSETRDGAEIGLSEQNAEGESLGETSRGNSNSRKAPLTVYTLNRKDMLDPLDPGSRQLGALFGPRTGTAWSTDFRKAVWRSDMGDLILGMMRRTVVDALITRADRVRGPRDKFIQSVPSWEAVRDVKYRQSVLWLPREAQDGPDSSTVGSEYATLDVDDVQYYRKMPVHNLNWLLGSEEVARLKGGTPTIFGKHELLVLKQWGSHSMLSLHLLLWRLHGYLAPTTAFPDGPSPPKKVKQEPPGKTRQPRGPLEKPSVKKMARTIVDLMPPRS